MTKVIKDKKVVHVKSLLNDDEEVIEETSVVASSEVEEEESYVVLWKPLLSIRMVTHFSRYPRGSIPSSFSQYMSFDYSTGYYYPIIYLEEFWLMEKNMIIMNRTDDDQAVPLQLSYSEISPLKWQFQVTHTSISSLSYTASLIPSTPL